ncbi:hypothetical protein Rxycam_00216 [Rubrobacter xylanophilus DSM 9941]|uniref:glycosyltransferase family 39 protein n=1 Tax=Rubrobacter xylanophilus TaxID=49319 RepID=UPI001C63EBBC|nr:glycosyltransferase family 39 protein [Rubrobacter xylanophilus]QYJ14420.1 hypothetical protein Rxycam_00216 [Rubrobacter xylanophilus DSM 9941]
MLRALLLLLCLYLPGELLGRRLARKGDGLVEVLLLRACAALAVGLQVLVLLALAGRFSPAFVGGVLGACVLLMLPLARRTAGARPGRWDVAALALVAGAFLLYALPAEYVINSRDPGVYTLFAARLARTGELLHHDPLVGAVSGFHEFLEGRKYPGFFILGENLIVPQFFPGPFALLGFGALLGGVWGALYVVPVLGALSVGVAYALGRELFGPRAGLLGAALLAASYTQIWWSRHPSSEVMAQFFVLGGLWLAVRFVRRPEPLPGLLAGLLLGGAMLVRVDGFLAAAALLALFAWDVATRRPLRPWVFPAAPLALCGAAALLYLNTAGARYLYILYTEHGLREALRAAPLALAGTGLLAGGLLWVRRRWSRGLEAWGAACGGRVAVGLALSVVAASLWAYLIMPEPWGSLPENLRGFDAYQSQVVVRMVWFVTPPVAVLALAGLLLAARRPERGLAVFAGAVLAFGVLYVAVPNVAPDLPWATRRFVPAVFPGVCLFAGYAASEVAGFSARRGGRQAGAAAGALLAVLALGWTAHVSAPILTFRELDGALGALERVEREIPEGARVVYMEMPSGHDWTASTFEYLYGHPVLPYDRVRFILEADELEEAGLLRDAVYVTTDGSPAPLVSGLRFVEVERERVALPRLVPVEGHESRMRNRVEFLRKDYRIFQIEEER